MSPKSTLKIYDLPSQIFHWVTAVIVIVAFFLGPGDFGRILRDGIDPATRIDIIWHETLGITVLVLTLLRLLWVVVRPAKPMFAMAKTLQWGSALGHLVLWVLLIALPVTALLALGSEDHPLTLLGGLRVDHMPLITGSTVGELTDWGDVHKLLGDVLIWLAGLHAVAAIFHHAVLKDGVLKSMLPWVQKN